MSEKPKTPMQEQGIVDKSGGKRRWWVVEEPKPQVEVVGFESKSGIVVRVVRNHFFDDGKPFWDVEIFSKFEPKSIVYLDAKTKKEALYIFRNLKGLIP